MTISYDRRTALLVVDVQNDFADPRGSLAVTGGTEVIAVANAEIAAARSAGALVAYTADWHPATTPHFSKDGGIWPVHCVAGSWGADLHPDLTVDGPVVRKGVHGEDGYSGFSTRDPNTRARTSTELAALLRDHDIRDVVICGLATDYCVKETALDAIGEGFATTVLVAGVRAVELEPGDGERALDAIERAGGTVR